VETKTLTLKEKLSEDKCSSIEVFSDKQIEYIISSYILGKPYNLEYVLPAIAWQESCLGLYKLNMYDPSAGLYHAYLPSVMARHKGLKNTKFNRNKIAQMLVNDDLFAASEAINELKFWSNFYLINKKDYKNQSLKDLVIKSYNRGIRWHRYSKDNKSAKRYLKQVLLKIEKIKKFIKNNDIDKEINKIYH